MTSEDQATFERAVAGERRLSGRRVSSIRLLGATTFLLLFGVLGGILHDPAWTVSGWLLGSYWLAAVLVAFGGKRWPAIAEHSSLAIAFLDMPMVFVLQRTTFPHSDPSGVAGFTIAIFVLATFLAALSPDRLAILLGAGVAVLLGGELQREAGVSLGAIVATAVVIGLSVAVAFYGRLRLRELLRSAVSQAVEQRELQDRLVRSDRLASLGTLAASIAHDVNNPMTAVYGGIELTRETIRDLVTTEDPSERERIAEEADGVLANALDGAENVQRLVRDLTALSRADARVSKTVDLRKVLQSAGNLTRHAVSARARLELELGECPAIRGDPARLGQVFINLIVNASQACAASARATNRISVKLGRDATGWALVRVEDTGAGMSEEVRLRIFEPFFTTKPEGEGTGLGLHICQTIVASHGGTVAVESRLGHGTSFDVRLPPLAAD